MKNSVKSALLWILALIVMFSAASYQRRTGPTYEVKSQFEAGGEAYAYELLRSANTTEGALVSIPEPGSEATAVVGFRRYPTDQPFTEQDLESVDGRLVGRLPVQPAAGKVEYYVELRLMGGDPIRLPDNEEGSVVLRYKDPVPLGVLLPHVLVMFLSMMVGIRTALGAVFLPGGVRKLAWTTLGGITLGGMVLGPIVQKYAFGALWTGFPFGYDLTDNKTLIMWVAWIGACIVVGRPARAEAEVGGSGRFALVAAAIVTLVVYMIPHSFKGSELDYEEGEIKVGQVAPYLENRARLLEVLYCPGVSGAALQAAPCPDIRNRELT